MQRATDSLEFARLWTGLAEVCGGQVTKHGIAIAFAALSPYSLDQIRSAANHIARTRTRYGMPLCGEIIEAIDGSRSDTARSQAYVVVEAIGRVGSYGTPPEWGDPITADLMRRRWSWHGLCSTLTEDGKQWFVKEFIEAYLSSKRTSETLMIAGAGESRLGLLADWSR